MGILSLFHAVLAVIGVLFLSYWCSRMLGKQWGMNACSGNMKVISQLQVGQDRRILLLRTGEHHYLVGVSQAGIQLLAEVEGDFEEDMPLYPKDMVKPSFQEILDKYRKFRDEKKGVDR